MPKMKTTIKFCSFGGYRLFCDRWWADLSWYVIGLRWRPSYERREMHQSWWRSASWCAPGWCHDLYDFWHRGRYGWAARDTWSLDYYLNRVLAGSLEHLADHTHGAPAGYGMDPAMVTDETPTDFGKWDADLRRWAKAFSEDPSDVDIYDAQDGYVQHRAEEERRRAALHQTLREIEPWWESLWD